VVLYCERRQKNHTLPPPALQPAMVGLIERPLSTLRRSSAQSCARLARPLYAFSSPALRPRSRGGSAWGFSEVPRHRISTAPRQPVGAVGSITGGRAFLGGSSTRSVPHSKLHVAPDLSVGVVGVRRCSRSRTSANRFFQDTLPTSARESSPSPASSSAATAPARHPPRGAPFRDLARRTSLRTFTLRLIDLDGANANAFVTADLLEAMAVGHHRAHNLHRPRNKGARR